MGFWKGVLGVVSAIPVVGHVTAGVQFIAGDKEGAQKSLASSTGNLVGALGAVGGFAVGGPAGAVAGGAAGAALGGQIENKINGKDLDFSAGKLLGDAALGGVTSFVGGGGVGGALKSVGGALGKEAGKTTLKIAAGSGLKTALTTVAGQVVSAGVGEIGGRKPSTEHGHDDDPEVPEEKIRIVTQRQDAKALELKNYCIQFNDMCVGFGMPDVATYHVRSFAMNCQGLLVDVRHPLPWHPADQGVEAARQMLVQKKSDGSFIQDQNNMNATGHGFDLWPQINTGLERMEQLLQELIVDMLEEQYMVAGAIPH